MFSLVKKEAVLWNHLQPDEVENKDFTKMKRDEAIKRAHKRAEEEAKIKEAQKREQERYALREQMKVLKRSNPDAPRGDPIYKMTGVLAVPFSG